MDVRLDGKSAIVTGDSKGLGLAIAEEYVRSGADVAILARDPGTLAEAKAKIQDGAPGRKIAAISCDVSKAADIRRTYDQIMSEFGKVDIFVNNAGQSTRGPSETLTDENWAIVERLDGFASERGHSLLELTLSWLARRPAVTSVFAGATRPEQVEENARAVGWALTREEMQEIDRLTVKQKL